MPVPPGGNFLAPARKSPKNRHRGGVSRCAPAHRSTLPYVPLPRRNAVGAAGVFHVWVCVRLKSRVGFNDMETERFYRAGSDGSAAGGGISDLSE